MNLVPFLWCPSWDNSDIRYEVIDLDTASVSNKIHTTKEQLSYIKSTKGFVPIIKLPLATWEFYLGGYVLGTVTTLRDYLGKIAPELLL